MQMGGGGSMIFMQRKGGGGGAQNFWGKRGAGQQNMCFVKGVRRF